MSAFLHDLPDTNRGPSPSASSGGGSADDRSRRDRPPPPRGAGLPTPSGDEEGPVAPDNDGSALPAGMRDHLEGMLGENFDDVRIHAGDGPAAAAKSLDARAFTVGQDIHLGPGERPNDLALIAHEVAHTVQQRGGAPAVQNKRAVADTGDAAEVEADSVAGAVLAGQPAKVSQSGASDRIHRVPAGQAKPETGKAPEKAAVNKNGFDSPAAEARGCLDVANQGLNLLRGIGGSLGRAYDAAASPGDISGVIAEAKSKRDEYANMTTVSVQQGLGVWTAAFQAAFAAEDSVACGKLAAVQSGLLTALTQVSQAQRVADTAIADAQSRLDALSLSPGADPSGDSVKPAKTPEGKVTLPPHPLTTPKVGNTEISPSVSPGTGQVGVDTSTDIGDPNKNGQKKKVGVGGSVDVVNDSGKLAFEGMTFTPGFTWPGAAVGTEFNVSGEFGGTCTKSPPTFDGKMWSVSYTVGFSVAAGAGASLDTAGPKFGMGGKAGGSRAYGGSKVFATPEAAVAFYEGGLPPIDKMPADLKAIDGMKPGETVTLSTSFDVGLNASGSGTGVTVSVGFSGGKADDAKLTKLDGHKVQVTVRNSDNIGASGSFGSWGMSVGGGAGQGSASSQTVVFDLDTPAGEAAYQKWRQDPDGKLPAHDPGAKPVSSGQGTAKSTSYGGSILWGSGSTTDTTSEFTEGSADGKHSLRTIVGSQTSSSSGSADGKESRTDSLQISQLDKDPQSYTVTTNIDMKGSAKDTNAELARVPQDVHNQTLEFHDEKASGAWQVQSTYTKAQMDLFKHKVASGDFRLRSHAMEGAAGIDPGEDLKKVLADPNISEADKDRAMTAWFSRQGPDAGKDLQDAGIGLPKTTYALAGDKNMSGAAGQQVFDGRLADLEAKLDAGEDPKKLLQAVRMLAADEGARGHACSNPAKYKELPDSARYDMVKGMQANVARAGQLEGKVMAKLGEKGIDAKIDPSSELGALLLGVAEARQQMVEARGVAHAQRQAHDGQGALGHDTARDKVHSSKAGGEGFELARGLYSQADVKWAAALANSTTAEGMQYALNLSDTLSDAGKKMAVHYAGQARNFYHLATNEFELVSHKLGSMVGYLRSTGNFNKELGGLNYGHQSDLWIAMNDGSGLSDPEGLKERWKKAQEEARGE